MRNQRELVIGGLLVLWGLMVLISNLVGVSFWAFCWPSALILVGVWLLLRPKLAKAGMHVNINPFSNVRRSGSWAVTSEEFWTFVGDTRLDLTQAEFASNEVTFHVYGFVGNVRLRLPHDTGFSVSSLAFVHDARILGQKHDSVIAPVDYTSENYATAERKVRLETFFFVIDLDIEQD